MCKLKWQHWKGFLNKDKRNTNPPTHHHTQEPCCFTAIYLPNQYGPVDHICNKIFHSGHHQGSLHSKDDQNSYRCNIVFPVEVKMKTGKLILKQEKKKQINIQVKFSLAIPLDHQQNSYSSMKTYHAQNPHILDTFLNSQILFGFFQGNP